MSRLVFNGKIGPDMELAEEVFDNLRRIEIDTVKKVLMIEYQSDGQTRIAYLELAGDEVSIDPVITDNNYDITVRVVTEPEEPEIASEEPQTI